MKRNKYSDLKIAWFPEKLQSFVDGNVSSPIYIRIKPTNKCNHKCWFCVYNPEFSSMHHDIERGDELPGDVLLKLIDDIAAMGVKAVTFSGGGEPLCHRSIENAMSRVLDNKIALSIITNGQNLFGNRAEILGKAHWVRISVDYFDEESYKKSRGLPSKMYNNLLKNISDFASIPGRKADLGVNFIVNKDNAHHIEEATNLLLSLGVDHIRFSPMWSKDIVEYHSIIKDITVKKIKELRQNSSIEIYDSYSSVFSSVDKRSYNKCFFSQMVPVVAADGYLYPCHNMSYEILGRLSPLNIKDKSFKEIWFSDKVKEFFDTFDPSISCTGQCSNDKKNVLIHNMINGYGDPFV